MISIRPLKGPRPTVHMHDIDRSGDRVQTLARALELQNCQLPNKRILMLVILLYCIFLFLSVRSDLDDSHEPVNRYRGEAGDTKPYKPVTGGHYERMTSKYSTIYSTDELIGRLPCRQLTFESDLSGRIYKSPRSGHFVYEPDGCLLRRLGAAEARACLSSKRLVWMGDSVMRYQFTSLAAFLATGGYQNPYDDGGSSEPSVSNVNHWPGRFSGYYTGLVKFLKAKLSSQGTAKCVRCSKKTAEENWYVTFKKDSISLDFKYLYKYPTWSRVGTVGLDWALGRHQRGGSDNRVPEDRPPPDFVIFNMCTWWSGSNMTSLLIEMEKIFDHGENLMSSNPDLKLIWRTCLDVRFSDVSPQLDDLARDRGWIVYDLRPVHIANVKQGIHWSWNGTSVHWIQLGYETFNDILLNVICND